MKPDERIDNESPDEILRALAVATTVYYEASPDRIEKARLQYEEVLEKFNRVRATPTVLHVGSRSESRAVLPR